LFPPDLLAGERDLVVVGLCMVLGDGVLCGGFSTDGYVKVVLLCVGVLWMLLCAVEAYCSDRDADLAIYNKVAEVWNIGRCCLFLVSVVAGGRSGRFAYQLAEKPGWDLSPTFHGGFASLRGSSSSGGLEALVPVASDSSVSDDVRPSRSSFTKQVGFDVLHKTVIKTCVALLGEGWLQAVCSGRPWRGRPGAYKNLVVIFFLFKSVLVTFVL